MNQLYFNKKGIKTLKKKKQIRRRVFTRAKHNAWDIARMNDYMNKSELMNE